VTFILSWNPQASSLVLTKGVCDPTADVWPANDLVKNRGKSIDEVVARAIRLLSVAPRVQDDMEVFVALPREQVAQFRFEGQVIPKETSAQGVGVMQKQDTGFWTFDTHPTRALARYTAAFVEQSPGMPQLQVQDPFAARPPEQDPFVQPIPFFARSGGHRRLIDRTNISFVRPSAPRVNVKLRYPYVPNHMPCPRSGGLELGDDMQTTLNPSDPITKTLLGPGGSIEVSRLKGVVVLRALIVRGTPALPVFSFGIPRDNPLLFGVMPIVFPPVTLFGDTIVQLEPRCNGKGGIVWQRIERIRLNPLYPVPYEAKEGRSIPLDIKEWPPLPAVSEHPPIQTFVDVPLARYLPERVLASCWDADWFIFLRAFLTGELERFHRQSGVSAVPNVCLHPERQKEPLSRLEDEFKFTSSETFWVNLTQYVRESPSLLLLQPKSENSVPYALRRELLWYRFPDAPIPVPLRFYQEPCTKPFTSLPLSLNVQNERSGHKNALLIDHRRKIIERFEPHGEETAIEGWKFVDEVAPVALERLLPGYRYEPASASCPRFPSYLRSAYWTPDERSRLFPGPQALSAEGQLGAAGYCLCWSWMYLTLRILNPSWTPAQIQWQMNRGGSANWTWALPELTPAVFPDPLDAKTRQWLATLSRQEHALLLARYVILFNQFAIAGKFRTASLASLPPPKPPAKI